MKVIGPAALSVSVILAAWSRLRRTVNSPSSVSSCRMFLVGAAVVDVAPVEVDVVDAATGVVGAVTPDATVVEAAAVVEAESDPLPHEAIMIVATQLRLS